MENNQVRSTRNYDQFTLIDTNRAVNKSHVGSLSASMEEDGNFTANNPIIVNERLEVIDGQHRLMACQSLGLPVYYVINRGLTVNDARKMNILHRRWTAVDFLESYVNEGRETYKQLAQLREEYPNLSMTTLILFSYGKYWDGYNAQFRKGELEPFDIEKARERIEVLLSFQTLSEAFSIKSMSLALLAAMRVTDIEMDRLYQKVRSHQADVRAFQNVSDNLRQLEHLYNLGRTSNTLRFF